VSAILYLSFSWCNFLVVFFLPASAFQPFLFDTMTSEVTSNASRRLPVVFVSHGGGPCFFMEPHEFGGHLAEVAKGSEPMKSLQRIPAQLNVEKPDAIVIISAHWESDLVRITARDEYPKLLYDYGGFPPHTYKIEYRAPGASRLAGQIFKMFNDKGIPSKLDLDRNWDHGVFVPLKVMYPEADIPIVQVSILRTYDPAAHIAIGKALAPLRDQNVLIVGSGFATHNFAGPNKAKYNEFVDSLTNLCSNPNAEEREKGFINWTSLPSARVAHAQEDHLVPLHCVVGAALDDTGKLLYKKVITDGSFIFANYAFGV